MSQIDLYFSLPSNVLKFKKNENNRTLSYVEYSVIVNDSLYNDLFYRKQGINLIMTDSSHCKGGNFIIQQPFVLQPGNYFMTLKVENQISNRMGLYKIDLPVRRFSSTKLCMSDLKIATKISQRTENSNQMYLRRNIQMTPHPFKSILRTKPIYVY